MDQARPPLHGGLACILSFPDRRPTDRALHPSGTDPRDRDPSRERPGLGMVLAPYSWRSRLPLRPCRRRTEYPPARDLHPDDAAAVRQPLLLRRGVIRVKVA